MIRTMTDPPILDNYPGSRHSYRSSGDKVPPTPVPSRHQTLDHPSPCPAVYRPWPVELALRGDKLIEVSGHETFWPIVEDFAVLNQVDDS